MKEVLLHVRLIELASAEDHPSVHFQEVVVERSGRTEGPLFRLTFASLSPISWPAMADALDGSSIYCKKVQIFEKKGLTLGIAILLVPSSNERLFKARAEAALRSTVKKLPRSSAANVVKLPFGFCGCQEQGAAGILDEESEIGGGDGARLECERVVMGQALYFCVPFREQLLDYHANNKNTRKAEENLLTCLADLFYSDHIVWSDWHSSIKSGMYASVVMLQALVPRGGILLLP